MKKNNKFQICLTLKVFFSLIFIMASVSEAKYWEIIDLKPFVGDTRSNASCVNEKGQVAGWSSTASDERHAFVWSKETGMINIGTPNFTDCEARAINNNGQVVGYINIPFQGAESFIWTEEDGMVVIEKGTHPNYEIKGLYADSINDQGHVVGHMTVRYDTGLQKGLPFIWDKDNGVRDLNDLVLRETDQIIESARDINNNDKIVVNGDNFVGTCFIGGYIKKLSAFTVRGNYAFALNDPGQVVVRLLTQEVPPQYRVGALWHEDELIILGSFLTGTLPCSASVDTLSSPRDINVFGKVVGWAPTDSTVICNGSEWDSYWYHAFIWDKKNEMIDLNDLISPNLGYELTSAYAINDKSQVAGNMKIDSDGDGKFDTQHGFFLIPPTETTINSIIKFFDESSDNGNLAAIGKGNSANARLNSIRNKLIMADNLINNGEIDEACVNLESILKFCDGITPPPDHITGPAVPELSGMISELMVDLGCD